MIINSRPTKKISNKGLGRDQTRDFFGQVINQSRRNSNSSNYRRARQAWRPPHLVILRRFRRASFRTNHRGSSITAKSSRGSNNRMFSGKEIPVDRANLFNKMSTYSRSTRKITSTIRASRSTGVGRSRASSNRGGMSHPSRFNIRASFKVRFIISRSNNLNTR